MDIVAEPGNGRVTDITVGLVLQPRPAVGDFEDTNGLAEQKFAAQACVGRRVGVERQCSGRDLPQAGGNEPRRLDRTLERSVSQIGAVCIQARIENFQEVLSCDQRSRIWWDFGWRRTNDFFCPGVPGRRGEIVSRMPCRR